MQRSCCLKYLSIPRQRGRQEGERMRTSNLTTNVFNQSTSSPTSTTDQSQLLASWALRLSHPNPNWIHFLLQSLIRVTRWARLRQTGPSASRRGRTRAQDPVEGELLEGPALRRAWRQLTWREKNNIPLHEQIWDRAIKGDLAVCTLLFSSSSCSHLNPLNSFSGY